MLPKLKQFSVCKGQRDSTMPQHEPRPFPSSNVISCMFPYKQSWQSGWPRCHSLFSPQSNSDAQRRSLPHCPPVCSRLFFGFFSWKSYGWVFAVWGSRPHHHCLALLLTRWLTSARQWSRCLRVKDKWNAVMRRYPRYVQQGHCMQSQAA